METPYFAKNPDIVARKEQKEALLFNPVDGNLVCINGTGIFVWDLCDASHTIGDIAREVAERYEISPEKAKEDCFAFLKELEEAGFIMYKL